MKITSYSKENLQVEGSLLKGIECLLNGIYELKMSGANKLLASTFTSSPSRLAGYPKAKEYFSQADIYFAGLLMSSVSEYHFDGDALVEFLIELADFQESPYKLATRVYDHPKSNQQDYDMAYKMYQVFMTAIGHLKDILDKIKSGEIQVKWEPDTEPSYIPSLNLPKQLNRKHKP